MSVASIAHGQARDPAAAQALFDAAQALKKQRHFEEACAKFSESQSLDPQVGTQLNLADCYERIGKTASAWVNFVEVADAAKLAGQTRRTEEARRRADALEPKLAKLSIEVAQQSTGFEIRRDGVVVGQASWGMPTPVDPGQHRIVATAPGKREWTTNEHVEPGETLEVRVPSLADAGARVDPPVEEQQPVPWKIVLGGSLCALGVAGVVVGTVFTVITVDKNDESKAFCRPEDPNVCDQPGLDLRNDAAQAQTAAIVGFTAGGALLVGGVVLLVLGLTDSRDVAITPALGPHSMGLNASGRF